MKRINLNKFLCFILAQAFLCTINGQENQSKITLSLEEVIGMAKKNSPQAKIAKFKYLEKYWVFRSFKAQFLPYLEANAVLPAYNNSIQNITQQDGTLRSQNVNTIIANAGLSLNQRIGLTNGTIGISTDLRRTENIGVTNGKQFISNPLFITYSQNILGYNNLRWSKRIEPLKFEEAKREYLEEMEDINLLAVRYYFQLLNTQVDIQISDKNIRNYDTLYHIAKGRYELGKIAENDLLQLELRLMDAKLFKEKKEIDMENALYLLKSFLRIKDHQDIKLAAPIPENIQIIPLDKALTEAQTNTSANLKLKRTLLEAESELARNKYSERYKITLNASYGINAQGEDLKNSYQDFKENQTANLSLNIPILSWGRYKGKIKMAESRLDLVRTDIDQKRVDYIQNIILNVKRFNTQKNRLRIAAKSDTIAKLRYDITQKRYLIGKINDITELNQAQVDNDNSKKQYYDALEQYWRNYYEIRKLTLYNFEQDRIIYVNLNNLY